MFPSLTRKAFRHLDFHEANWIGTTNPSNGQNVLHGYLLSTTKIIKQKKMKDIPQ